METVSSLLPNIDLSLDMLTSIEFVDYLRHIRYKNKDYHYRFIYTSKTYIVDIDYKATGAYVFTETDLEKIAQDYRDLLNCISDLENKGWVFNNLSILHLDGFSGISCFYKNPKGIQKQNRYVRNNSKTDIIPKDFLTDISQFHNRFLKGI